MPNIFRAPSAESTSPIVRFEEHSVDPPIQSHFVSTRELLLSRLKRFDKPYAAAALYFAGSFPLLYISMILGNGIVSLPGFNPPGIHTGIGSAIYCLGTISAISMFLCWQLSGIIRIVAPKNGKSGVIIGSISFFACCAWFYLRAYFYEESVHDVSSLSKITNRLMVLFLFLPQVVAVSRQWLPEPKPIFDRSPRK